MPPQKDKHYSAEVAETLHTTTKKTEKPTKPPDASFKMTTSKLQEVTKAPYPATVMLQTPLQKIMLTTLCTRCENDRCEFRCVFGRLISKTMTPSHKVDMLLITAHHHKCRSLNEKLLKCNQWTCICMNTQG